MLNQPEKKDTVEPRYFEIAARERKIVRIEAVRKWLKDRSKEMALSSK